MTEEFTHVEDGDVDMVDVGDKPDSHRRAVARGEIRVQETTATAVRETDVGKGDVLTTAEIAAVQAVKRTWDTVPLCHHIPISNVDTDFDVRADRVVLEVAVETTGTTGCEMEAIQGVQVGLATVWDMVKSAEKADDGGYPTTAIEGVEVVEKTKEPAGE